MSEHEVYFDVPQPHKLAKVNIASKYFGAWSRIVGNGRQALTYLDLCSGPGRFNDGTPSTPVRVMEEAARLPDSIRRDLRLYFYEADPQYYATLRNNVFGHPACASLRHAPVIENCELTAVLVHSLPTDARTFSFIDPFSYREISFSLLSAAVQNWGSDCLFFLSTSGIRRNLYRECEGPYLIQIFGEERLTDLRRRFAVTKGSRSREQLMLRQLEERLNETRTVYFLDFAVEFEQRRDNSHYLIFLSKSSRGFAVMKEIMSQESICDLEDIPVYIYRNAQRQQKEQSALCLGNQMADLQHRLVADFRGKKWRVKDLIDRCHVQRYRFPSDTIRSALIRLESVGKLVVDKPQDKRMVTGKVTLGDARSVRFVE